MKKGELVVLGSGLGAMDFLADSRPLLNSADQVFYVAADPLTRFLLRTDYPSAIDLAVLYRADRLRYDTYIFMVESILQCVRAGQRVVVVFYGHPGVFATATHRAVNIARAEGHDAFMRPGVSALDYMVADLGFDPALPGLLSYEATDMILRNRYLDTTLHAVIWQVGAVAETGFSNLVYENAHFETLLDYLSHYYGSDAALVHYIAAQFPDRTPLIERRSIKDFRSTAAKKSISAKSTFYLPPKYDRLTDGRWARALGMSEPIASLSVNDVNLTNKCYSEYDLGILQDFDRSELGSAGIRPPTTPGGRFLLALAKDPSLAALFKERPTDALADPRFSDLSDQTRSALIEGGAQNIARVLAGNG